jgi:hypothetical protein
VDTVVSMAMDLSNVTKYSTWVPLAHGKSCTHGRAVLYNLMHDVVIHADDDTRCDGDIAVWSSPPMSKEETDRILRAAEEIDARLDPDFFGDTSP